MLILLINKHNPHKISEEMFLFMGKCKLWRAALSAVGFFRLKNVTNTSVEFCKQNMGDFDQEIPSEKQLKKQKIFQLLLQ